MLIYSIYDKTAKQWALPFTMPHSVAAIRAFRAEINRQDERNPLYTHPAEFSLHQIAKFDEETGSCDKIEKILVAEGQTLKYEDEVS
jgi:hypothetical protein